VPAAAIQSATVPVTVVAAPPRRTAKEQADHIMDVGGRIGCRVLIAIILFKVVLVVVVILGGLLLMYLMGLKF
jgi:hypothetical protein